MKKKYIQKRQELFHYASPYYDPVKAHEYYMRTRELKGRKSTSGLNEAGRTAAMYVKQQINSERDSKLAARKSRYDSDRDSARNKRTSSNKYWTDTTKSLVQQESDKRTKSIEQHTTQMKTKIQSLSEDLKNLSAEDKRGSAGEQIRNEIAKLREDNAAQKDKIRNEAKTAITRLRENSKSKRTAINSEYKTTSDKLRTDYSADRKAIRSEAEEKYIAELDRMKGDSSMRKVTKTKRKKKS